MTQLQKDVTELLFRGHNIAYDGSMYRVRNERHEPVAKINWRTFYQLKKIMRKSAEGLFVLDKRKVRAMSGKAWVKQFYKKQAAKK